MSCSFFKELQSVFYVKENVIASFMISIETFYLTLKESKKIIVKICGFIESEFVKTCDQLFLLPFQNP